MHKSKLLNWLLAPFFMSVADEGGGGGGGAEEDRGDALPGEDSDDSAEKEAAAKAEEEAAAAKAEEEAAAAAAKAEEEAAAAITAKAEEETGDEDKTTKKDTRIPLSRHKQMLEKERAARETLEAELVKLRGGERTARTSEEITANETKIDELEGKYTKMLVDGETDKAASVMKEIRKLEREVSDRKSDIKAAAAETRAVERVRFDSIVDRIEEAYPEMNPKHDDYSEEKVAEVLELQQAFLTQGIAPSTAIQRAVKYVLGAVSKETNVGDEKTADATAKISATEATAKARKTEQLKKNIDTALKQPSSTTKVGMDSDKAGGGAVDGKAIMKMSQTDFNKLDEKELARLRGDDLAA